ncbi:hypothetical protein DNTS_002474 [Danionella cerebrum]|uniref:Acyl-coenzyme A diphosphatase NUDT19 n=1 Tax=Danionella cerebrum TaxID=2873325 RepID=A0A553PXH6_9TELE|nr:hypothetical protein DNTS_002474 [Danionella translucida]
MNTALKHWREAATVILAAGQRRAPTADTLKVLENAAKSVCDYQVLLLKRSGRSGFMPNAYVFPGGLVDASDFSSEWQDIFKHFTKAHNYGIAAVKQPPETRPPIFATDRAQLGSPIPGDVAFRICAVRETFEESGVLLALPKHEARGVLDSQPVPTRLGTPWSKDVLAKWRALVNGDPANFIKMCRELECLPNIWALHEWANWLTPVGKYGIRRYDTAFYLCCLDEAPHTLHDDKEIVHFKWSTPQEVLQRYRSKEIWIAPPQFYDFGRLCQFPVLKDLHQFAWKRSVEGCEQWLPVHMVTSDGFANILPGDMLYPEKVDTSGNSEGVLITEKSLDELQQDTGKMHRVVGQDMYSVSIQMNITPKYKHLPPVDSDNMRKFLRNSKL